METALAPSPQPVRGIGTPADSIEAFRRKARLGTLHPAIEALLTDHDEDWNTNRYELRWREDLERYRAFILFEGRSPSQTAKDSTERKLGYWAAAQRSTYREGTLKPERVTRLEDVAGHQWDPFEHTWNEQRSELHAYVAAHGQLPSKESVNTDEHTLARWVHRQRTLRRAGNLSAEREASLALIPGITWEPRDTAWPDSYARYSAFMIEHGREPVRVLNGSYEQQVAEWMHNQRTAKREGRLTDARIKLLEAVPGHQWRVRPERKRAV